MKRKVQKMVVGNVYDKINEVIRRHSPHFGDNGWEIKEEVVDQVSFAVEDRVYLDTIFSHRHTLFSMTHDP